MPSPVKLGHSFRSLYYPVSSSINQPLYNLDIFSFYCLDIPSPFRSRLALRTPPLHNFARLPHRNPREFCSLSAPSNNLMILVSLSTVWRPRYLKSVSTRTVILGSKLLTRTNQALMALMSSPPLNAVSAYNFTSPTTIQPPPK